MLAFVGLPKAQQLAPILSYEFVLLPPGLQSQTRTFSETPFRRHGPPFELFLFHGAYARHEDKLLLLPDQHQRIWRQEEHFACCQNQARALFLSPHA